MDFFAMWYLNMIWTIGVEIVEHTPDIMGAEALKVEYYGISSQLGRHPRSRQRHGA
jgi:hypothetical protein